MRHTSAWRAAGLVAVAAVLGCGPGKEMPDDLPAPAAPTGPPPDPFGPAPAESDPEARAVLVRAAKAVGVNVPGGLARAKVSRVTRTGKFQYKRPEMIDAGSRVEAVWPDRGHAVLDLDSVKATFRFRGRQGWHTQGLVTQDANPADLARIIRTDFHAQHWIPLGLTLADDKTVAFGRAATAGGTAVKVAVPDPPGLPVFLVTFDDKAEVPVRVEYHPVEQGGRVHKVLAMSGHQPFGGYFLPADTKLTQNGRLSEHWTTKGWEFPERLDEALFEAPKE
ncbi:MAG: hypothetical protein C0501_13200 [Isosphaera sp.]|nr:hypothetical protein [Isosphaera sp.]